MNLGSNLFATPRNGLHSGLKERLREHALKIGIDRIGITSAHAPEDYSRYLEWIGKGHAADLWYLTEAARVEKRGDLNKILPGIRTVIVGAVSYAPRSAPTPTDAKIARYAWGADYHDVLAQKLEQLASWLQSESPQPFRHLTYVDTGPILERSLAQRAGIGWIGKNTCVMHESTGSYLLLGEILTTLEIPANSPAVNHCGSCTRCVDACPTNALVAPYELDSRKCISYHTLESHSETIPEPIARNLDGWVAGCDICQEVCPWNRTPSPTRTNEFTPLPHSRLTLAELSKFTEQEFKTTFRSTGLKRMGLLRLLRNVRHALGACCELGN